MEIQPALDSHVHDSALELLAALDRQCAAESLAGQVQGHRDTGLGHAVFAQGDRLAGVHEHRLVAALVEVMHVLTEPGPLGVHVLGAAGLSAAVSLVLV
ncbi:hypothetical protein D9M70_533330 [compost metagenome]